MTKPSAAFLALVILVSAVTSWLIGILLAAPPTPVPSTQPSQLEHDEPAPPDTESRLRSELRDLRLRFDTVLARLAALEAREPSTARIPVGDWVTKEELDALQEHLRPPDTAWNVADGTAPEFKTRVADALTAIRKDEVQKAHEKSAAQLEERLTKLGERLGLDSYQTNEMRVILGARDERNRALIQMWQRGVDNEVLGEAKRSNAEEFETAVARVLTPEQLATLRENPGDGGKE